MPFSSQTEHQEQFLVYYHEYKHRICSHVLYRLNGDTFLAEDLTSDIFFKAYKSFHTYDKNTASFYTWIYRIARNTLIDHFRKNKISQTEYNDEIHGEEDDAHFIESLDIEIDMKKVYCALETLPETQKEVVVLKLLEHLDTREIALHIGKKPENVRKILSRGLSALRSRLIQIFITLSFFWI